MSASRALVVSAALALSSLLAACTRRGPPAPEAREEDPLIALAAPIRSSDPADVDYEDLAPLARSIGESRIVFLGETVHGKHEITRAKTRLVRFLHEKMGFDVLVWESNLWDCEQMERALHTEVPLDDAIATGLFPVLSEGGQLRALMSYARETHQTSRPLEMAGFDPQFSGRGRDGYPNWLLDLVDGEGLATTTPELRRGLREAFQRFPKKGRFLPLGAEVRAKDRAAIAAVLAALKANAGKVARVRGDREEALAERTLSNVLSIYDWHAAVGASDVKTEVDWRLVKNNQVRDTEAAVNVTWIARVWEPGKKLLVWAHNGHIARDLSAVEIPGGEYSYEDYLPMGAGVAAVWGREAYSLGFSARDEDAAPRSLEGRLGAIDKPFLFVDLRGPAGEPGHWLHGALTARPTGHVNASADWTRVFDGVFFVRDGG